MDKKSPPKYMMLTDWIKAEITSGNYTRGERFLSEKMIAEKFGVSRETVRKAISKLVNQGFLESRHGSGTFVAYERLLPRREQTKTIGVISTYLDSYIFPSIIRGIDTVLSKEGYSMQLSLTNNKIENEYNAVKLLMEKNVDGLIIEPTKSGLYNPNVKLYNEISKKQIPIIFFNSKYSDTNHPEVRIDDRKAGKMATEYLIKMGHKSIAGFFQSDDSQGHRRYAGYVDALIENMIGVNSEKILWFSTEDMPYFSDDFSRVLRIIKDATAILCYNDQIAFSLITELRARGISVPDKISVIGIDNAEIAAMCDPPLTTLSHPKEKLGEAAANSIIRLINDSLFDANVIFEPELIERDSVKKMK